MKNTNKKGFTIVELVIVIAVIAILAAVLIPTFASIVNKANISKDTQLIRNLNTALAAATNKPATMHDALAIAAEYGYDVEKINASATQKEIVWDSVNNLFCYYDAESNKVSYIPEFEPANATVNSQLWIIDDEVNDTFSTYYVGNEQEVTVSNGFDAGNSGVVSITYNKGSEAKNVVIRTNNAFGTLTINADTDEVQHYGEIGDLNVIAVKMGSYNEFGRVGGFAILTYGKINVKAGGEITTIVANPVNVEDVVLSVEEGSAVGSVFSENQAVIDAIASSNEGKISHTEVIESGKTEEFLDNVACIAHTDGSRTYYKEFHDACAAVADGETVVVMKDYQYQASLKETLVTIAADKKVTLDLNGKRIQAVLDNTKSISMFVVNGSLTIIDSTVTENGVSSGAIETANQFGNADPWHVASSVILNNGTVVLESGNLINRGGSGSYVIDARNNSITTINGGRVEATDYIAIRLFFPNDKPTTAVNINGGVVSGTKRDIWFQTDGRYTHKSSDFIHIADGIAYTVSEPSTASGFEGSVNYYFD